MSEAAGWLYESVGLGMAVYGRFAVPTDTTGLERVRPQPGSALIAAHLSDHDVPVIAGALYRSLGRSGDALRPAFAVADDLLVPGFLAGYPPGFPLPLRRALWPLGIGGVLRSRLRCLPVRFADRARLVELLRHDPRRPLDRVLPPALLEPLLARARALRRPLPRVAADVLDGRYADLLWRAVAREEGGEDAFWDARRFASGLDLRALAAHLRGGGALFLFPHGVPSADGAIAPLDARAGRMLRWLAPTAIQPLGIAYDPLVRGRPRAVVSAGDTLTTLPAVAPERAALAALRAATPIGVGHIVAHHAVTHGAPPSVATVLETLESTRHPLAPDRSPERVEQALAALTRLGLSHPLVLRTARTYATAITE